MIKKWAPDGVTVEKKDCLSHHEVMARAEVYDGERGVKLVGHRVRSPMQLYNEMGLTLLGLLPTKMGRPSQPSTYQLRATLPHLERLRSDTASVLHESRVHGKDCTARAI